MNLIRENMTCIFHGAVNFGASARHNFAQNRQKPLRSVNFSTRCFMSAFIDQIISQQT